MTGTTPIIKSTRHVFLDLPALTPDLDAYHAVCASGGGWSSNCATTTAAWMRDGLKPRCISRDLRWGTRVPRAGFEEKVLYVWFDAPVGYVSITATLTKSWEAWWRPAEGTEVDLVQFMGKDNVPFHTVIFPATLLGASRAIGDSAASSSAAAAPASSPALTSPAGNGASSSAAAAPASSPALTSPAGNGASDDPLAPSRPWALAKAISVTEYLNYEGGEIGFEPCSFLSPSFFPRGSPPKNRENDESHSRVPLSSPFFRLSKNSTGKFSKSRGLGVFGDDAARAGLSADLWRFYLLSSRPETSDTDFKWSDLAARTNAELLANLGNFCHRALSFAGAKLGGVVPRSAAEVLSGAGASSTSAALKESDAVKAAAAAAADLSSKVSPLAASYLAAMEKAKLREGARLLMAVSATGNKFLQEHAPWELMPKKKKKEAKADGEGEGGANGNAGESEGESESDPGRVAAGILLRAALGLVALLSGMAAPFVPAAAASLRVQLGLDQAPEEGEGTSSSSSSADPFANQPALGEERVAAASRDLSSLLRGGAPLGTPSVLFRAIPPEEVAALRERFGGASQGEGGGAAEAAAASAAAKKGGKPAAATAAGAARAAAAAPKKPAKKPKTPPEDPTAPITLSRLDLRVGVVLEAKRHPGAEKLFVEKIDLGESGGPRQVVSGLVDHIPLEQFVGSRVVCVCNARASAMRGEESQAMLLAATASDGGKVEVVSPPAHAKLGARVFVLEGEGEGLSASPDAEIDLRKSVAWPAIRDELKVDGEGRATYRGQLLRAEGADGEGCFAATVRGGSIG